MTADLVLTRIDKARALLSVAKTAQGAKQVAAMAHAAEVYARRMNAGEQVIREAHTIKIDAMTLLGEHLRAANLHSGRPKKNGSNREPLSEVGITKKDSMHSQFLVDLKELKPELHEQVRGGDVVMSAARRDVKRESQRADIESRARDNTVESNGPFQLILADPPWKYEFAQADSREIENQYPTAEPSEIAAHLSPISVTGDALLLLWATAPKLVAALDVMRAWGFEYRTHAVWDKEKIGMGYWFRGQHELLLVGVRGNVSPPIEDFRVSSVFKEPRGNHSVKPRCVYEWIERAFPHLSKLEMYSRSPRKGWAAWGNEA